MSERKLCWRRSLLGSATALSMCIITPSAFAQDEGVEEIFVTGSYIARSREDAAVPIDVVDREDLAEIGSPTVVELIRNLGVTSGNVGETNQFQPGGQANEGAATINMRGLGSARTLVLMNGKRHVATDYVGVDVNFIPMSAVGRIEVLKDGAAALYGSDAIGGVVNFFTRSDFEGLELNLSHQFISDSDGDTEVGGIFGTGNDKINWIIAANYKQRSKLRAADRDWAVLPYLEAPENGWSGIGNPGRILPAFGYTITGGGSPDPQCGFLGGYPDPVDAACRFQYTFFDNLIEDEETWSVYTEFNADLSDNAHFYAEAALAETKVDWNTSPSYPPQSLFGLDRFVSTTHPGFVQLIADNPAWWAATEHPIYPETNVVVLNRMVGVSGLNGQPEEGLRKIDQSRFVAGLEGQFASSGINYDVSLAWSKRTRRLQTDDMYVERMAFALDGLGGAGCDQSTGTPGVGDCEYYNPFSNAIQTSVVTGVTNPQYDASLANSPELLDWLTDTLMSDMTTGLLVFDAVLNGTSSFELKGGPIGWAAGFQIRKESYEVETNDVQNLDINPCPFNDPQSLVLVNVLSLDCAAPTGLFAFLAGTYESDEDRTIYGGFAELALPVTDSLDVQLALRYEDYGGNVGSTVDPKIAARLQVSPWFALRVSASTTFRGPPLPSLSGRVTQLQYVSQALAFKAIDTLGNPDLKPESATTINFGGIVKTDNFNASLDYWHFDFDRRLQTESFSQILGAYVASDCADGGLGVGSPTCDALRSHVFPLGTSAGGVERIEINFINGSNVVTSGFDFFAQYDFDLSNGTFSIGVEGTKTVEFESDDFKDINGVTLASGGDFVGFLNANNPFTPIQELKGNMFFRLVKGDHNASWVMRYVDSYMDEDPPAGYPEFAKIDSHMTHDFHYNYTITDKVRASLSVINVMDEDPPFASLDLNYDPFTHNAFGRMIKLGLTVQM